MVEAAQVQSLNEAVCISHRANTLGISMNSTILPLFKGKIAGLTELFDLDMSTSLREGKLNSTL